MSSYISLSTNKYMYFTRFPDTQKRANGKLTEQLREGNIEKLFKK